LHTCPAVVVILSKPDHYLASSLEYLAHEFDLLVSFFDTVLTDTDLVNPKSDDVVRIPEPVKSLYESFCHSETLAITGDVLISGAVSPCI
jgi:hypothetical protein